MTIAPTLFLQVALVGVASLLVVFGVAVTARRTQRSIAIARYEKRAGVLRPQLLRLLAEDEPDLSSLDDLARADAKLLESLVWHLLPKVRGASRVALVDWLDRRGAIARARARTHRRGVVGRALAAEHLGSAGRPEATDDIARLLNDRSQEVRLVAVRALGKLGDARSVPNLLDSLSGPRPVPVSLVSMAIIHIGPAAIDELIEGLARQTAGARAVCAELLGQHGALQAAKWLVALLESDPSDEVRQRAASSLGRLGVPQGVEPLTRAMAPSNPERLRTIAATALGHIGGSNALGALQNGIADENPAVASACASALSAMGEKGVAILELVATSENQASELASDWLMRARKDDGGTHFRASPRVVTRRLL